MYCMSFGCIKSQCAEDELGRGSGLAVCLWQFCSQAHNNDLLLSEDGTALRVDL